MAVEAAGVARVRVVEGRDPEGQLASLREWLGREDALRGRVRGVGPAVGAEDMGAVADTLAIALGSGGAVAVLAQSVSVWLQQRRSDVTVEVTSPSGQSVSVTVTHVRDAQAVIEAVLRPDADEESGSGS